MSDAALNLSIRNDIREIAMVAEKITSFCTEQGLDNEIAYAVNLGVEEIIAHTISNGYEDEDIHGIEIVLDKSEREIMVFVVDDSSAFDVSTVQEPDMEQPLEERTTSGLGLFLVRQMMDGITYQRFDGCNIVTLWKKLAPPATSPQ